MPSDSREPENYSISEMMDRLKERSSGDRSNGELVTRADGSQAIKVRSRKRRSHQPHRENEQRQRRVRAVQLVGVVVVAVLLLVLATAVVVYMNGSPYRNKIMDRVVEATGAKAEVITFRVTPIGASADSLALEWPDEQPMKKLHLEHITSELRFSSFLGQPWTGEEIAAQKGQLLVGMPSGDSPSKDGVDFFHFNRFRCADLSVYFGDPRAPSLSILNSEMSLYPKGAGGRPELRCNRGRVKFGRKLPELELDRALIGVTGRRLDIVNFRLLEPGEGAGTVEIVGQVEPSDSGRATTLDTKVKDMPIELLGGPDLGNILRGRVESRNIPQSNFVTFDPSKPDSLKLVMSFQGVGDPPMTLSQLPFLSRLRGIFHDSGYERPVLDSGATGVLRISGSEISLSDLRLESMSRMTIRGNMTVGADRALGGRLEVGLPVRLVESEPELDAAFGPRKEDLRWLEVNLSGTTDVPADDFNRKVPVNHTSGSAAGGAASEFQNLTQPR